RSIWERTAPLRFMRDRTVEDLWGYCRSCYYGKTCLAGCTWTSHVILGRAGKRERLVPVESAPGAPFDHGIFRVVVEDDATYTAPSSGSTSRTSTSSVPPRI